MTSRRPTVLLIALATLTAGCSGGKSNRNDGGGAAPPLEASYTVAVTAVDVVNKDTGEQLAVGGLPAQGGELNIQ